MSGFICSVSIYLGQGSDREIIFANCWYNGHIDRWLCQERHPTFAVSNRYQTNPHHCVDLQHFDCDLQADLVLSL